MYLFGKAHSRRYLFWLNCLFAVSVLLVAGMVYRVVVSQLKVAAGSPIVLPVPLSAFPEQIHDWRGKDAPIAVNIQRVAGNDDFVNRLYVNESNGQWANVYIAYTARPGNMIGHQPQVCYVAGGWVHDSTEVYEVIYGTDKTVPCLVHRFHRPGPESDVIVVLNFYIVNGQLTRDESVFTGFGWRTPNIAGDPARYVAQVQISSLLETSVRVAAKDMTRLILDFFPDEGGKVRAAEYVSSSARTAQ